MLVFLSHRRIKPGSWEAYRKAWEPDQLPEGVRERIYHARSLTDPDEIISFGILEAAPEDLAAMREQFGGDEAEARRQARMGEVVTWTGVDQVFEVVEELALH